MYCQNCGTALPDQTPSCPTCGMKFAVQPPAYVPPAQPTAPMPPVSAPQSPVPAPPAAPVPAPPAASPQEPVVHPPTEPPGWQPPAVQPPAGQATGPKPKKRRTGLIVGIVIAVVLLLLLAAAAAVLALMPARTSSSTSPAYAPVYPKISPATTAGIDVSDNTAAENVVVAFYDRINAGDYAAVRKLVADDTKSAVDKGAFAKWTTTTVEVAQSTVDGNAAEILVRESVREFGSKDRGVKFVLGKIQGVWLIRTWTGVDEATLNGAAAASGAGAGATTLNEATARNLVSTLLKARQGGDAATIRVLTTQKFQEDNAAVWLDGVDNTPYFTAFSIKTAKAKGATWVVTVTEQWNSGAETGTYTVVKENSAILVSAWSSK